MVYPDATIPIVWGLVLALCCSACSFPSDSDPNVWPYQVQKERDIGQFVPVDLEGNGRDERVSTARRSSRSDGPDAVVLATLARRTIQQVNYAATITDDLQFLDLDGDGTLEILVPIVRNDSLFMSVVTAEGRKTDRFFVTTGEPRQEPEGEISWDPWVNTAFMADVTEDGRSELVLGVTTRYAQLPRGVWVFSWPGKRLLGQVNVGAYLRLNKEDVGDFDADEKLELLFTSSASDNGANAGGLSDRYSYVGAFELGTSPRLDWHRQIGGIWSSAYSLRGNMDGDGTPDFITYKWITRGRSDPTFIQRIDPGSGRVLRERSFTNQIRDAATVDMNGDARDEVLVLDTENILYVLNGNLEVTQRRALDVNAGGITILPDADDDQRSEIVVGTDAGTFFFDGQLNVKVFTPLESGTWRAVQRGNQRSPFIYAETSEGAQLLRLVPNPWYVWHRYGPWGLMLLGAVLIAGIGWGGRRLYRRNRELQEAQAQVLASSTDGLLLVQPHREEVEYMNPSARKMLGVDGASAPADAVKNKAPALLDLIQRARQEGNRVEAAVQVGGEGTHEKLAAVAVPINGGQWLVRLQDPSGTDGSENEYRAWGLMARRVAHDLKNPLTSILLTLQRLQMEYREQAPEVADDLDDYTARIEERIEHLRRMTKNFMKFMDAEASALTRTALNQFLETQADHLRTALPPDITLSLKLEPGLPAVNLDTEQIQSVLENLIANAVNALPEGGQITIGTHLERGLRFSDDGLPRDYVELEVLDTGTGMDAATRDQLFEPGFTTTEEGTGLGLAIVQKIIADHEGHIEVESEIGVGTAFCIYLPAAEARHSGDEHEA